jgi:inosine/guanosine/xanthosine phosphorylase family protein
VIARPPIDAADGIVAEIRRRTELAPSVALVLGSGLGETIRVAKEARGADAGLEFAYAELPGFPPPTAMGHAGKLWIGALGAATFASFQGRIHFYEGHGMGFASITSQVAAALGAQTIVLTAAVGAIDRSLPAGAIVVVRDHLNLMGTNALQGWRMADGSPAFVDVAGLYDEELSRAALDAAVQSGSSATEGVYAAVAGPSYETPAETALMRQAGATVVGMSMVPEAVAARALGMRVLGLSFVTNEAGATVSHEYVLEASRTAADALGRIVAALVDRF